MNDSSPQPMTPDAPDTSASSTKRPWTILGRLAKALREQNWFAVVLELAIVVLGVVIGFQVTAWGQTRAEVAKEETYLRQLAADLRETEQSLLAADSLMAPQAMAGAQLVRAFFLPQEPPEDSLMAWLTGSRQTFHIRPVMATLDALVATGDLALIRDDSLRSAIAAHIQMMDVFMRIQDEYQTRWEDQFRLFVRRFNPVELKTLWRSPQQLASSREDPLWPFPEEARSDRFPFDARAFLNNRDAFDEAEEMRNVRRQMISGRRWTLGRIVALREQVEAELDR